MALLARALRQQVLFFSRAILTFTQEQSILRQIFGTLCPHFSLIFTPARSQECRTAVIRSAMESPHIGALNDGSNVEI